MKYYSLLVLFIICFCIGGKSQTVESFIEQYKLAYEKQSVVYKDTSLIYIPEVINLYLDSGSESWFALPASLRRERLWEYLRDPILANKEAINLSKKRRYQYPEGLLFHDRDSVRANGITEILVDDYFGVVVPLVDFLTYNSVDYIFTITNLNVIEKSNEMYWIIKDNQLYFCCLMISVGNSIQLMLNCLSGS
jgi:hypothetical protein